MATRAQGMTIEYHAWDTSANAPKTGDNANHTLRWIKDGTSSAPANSPAEVDATNAKGVYKLTLTSTETDCLYGKLAGVSSTANVALFGPAIGFDQLPVAVPGTINGLPILGANAASLSFTGLTTNILGNLVGTVSTLTTYTGNTPQTGDTYARLGAPAGASTAADIAAVKTDTAAVKTQTDKLTFTVANQVDVNVLDWKSATAPAMTGDAFARIGVAGVGLTNLGDSRIANLDAAVSSRMATFTLPTNFSALGITAGGKISGVVLADTLTTYTGNTPQTGDVFATANAEPTSVIASNASLATKISWMTAQSLNKITQTATTMIVRNNADSGTIATSATSDDGTTATRGAFA